jgi:hypothetical protein
LIKRWIPLYFAFRISNSNLIFYKIRDYSDNRINFLSLIYGASEFQGKWIHFGSKYYPDWKTILEYFKK